jgi:putative ABC transport system permease protein
MIKDALNITDEGNIATLAPKLYVNTTVKGASLIAVGVDPAEERAIKTWWRVGQGEYFNGSDQALVGALAAHLLQISPGDKLTLKNREVTVAGVLEETGSGDDYQIFVPLATLQGAFGKEGQVSSLDIRALCNACPVDYIAEAINGTIPGVRAVAVKQVAETEMELVLKMKNFMLALAGITLLVGLFAVVNTMLASVHERIKDIGIMKAIGASRNQIVRIFIYEAIIIGLGGGILGYLIGSGLAYLVGPLLFDGASITYVPQYLPLSLAVAALTAVTATVYPALRATQVKVAESLRSI